MDNREFVQCFGCWRYYSSSALIRRFISSDADEERHLSRDAQIVLDFFLNNPGKLVTKKELAMLLGVNEHKSGLYLLRVIGSLRKTLDDDSRKPTYIQTHKKRGFRFIAQVYPEPEKCLGSDNQRVSLGQSGVTIFNRDLGSKSFTLISIISLFAFLFVCYFLIGYQSPVDVKIKVVSELKGVELQPSISPDEKYVVYSHSENRFDRFSMILHNLVTGEKSVLKSERDSVLHGFVWSADQRSIFYQRLLYKQSCEIRRIILNGSKVESDTLVSRCGIFSFAANVQISPDQKFLFYPSRNSSESGSVIFKYSLENGTSEQITAPPKYGFGDYSISLSADGTKIAFLRDYQFTNAELWVLSLESKSLEMVYQSPDFYPLMISWANDQDNILIPDEDKGILSVSHLNKEVKKFRLIEKPIKEIFQTKSGRYLVSYGSFWDSSTWMMNNPLINREQLNEKLPYSKNEESIVTINHVPRGPSAIFSTTNGTRSLTFIFPDGQEIVVRKPQINDKYANGIFSADGSRFLFRVGSQLWVNDVAANSKQLPLNISTSSKFSWSADGNLVFFTSSLLGQQQVFVHNLSTSDTSSLDYNLKFYAESPSGDYSIQLRYNQPYLEIKYRSDGKTQPIKSTIDPDVLISRVVLRRYAVYFYVPTRDKKFEIVRFNLKSGAFENTGIQQSLKGRAFNVSDDERVIYLDDGKKGNVDIAISQGG